MISFCLLVEKRGALGIGNGLVAAAPADVAAGPDGDGNAQGRDKEDAHDDKGKDPLEGDNVTGELSDTNGGSEDGEGEAHGVILKCRQ